MKKIFSLIVAAAFVTISTANTSVAFVKDNDNSKKETEKKAESSTAIQGGTFQYDGPNGGGTNDEWKDTARWSSITGSLPCPGQGEACMIEVPAGQTLQQFLDSKSSYQDLLEDEEHVEQRAP